jgi:type IV secretion system protein VirB9
LTRPAFALACLVAAQLAAAVPAFARDSRLATRQYNPDEVVRIEGHTGVQASIEFAEDEHIENVAVGDSNAWQITPNKRANLLFVKPLSASARTNMTVVTDRRTYFFDLHASPSAQAIYLLRFIYPDEPKATAQQLTPAEAEATRAPAEAFKDPSALNFAWVRKGTARLLPAQVYDDGDSTYLSWEARVPLPAILIRNEKGEEGPVNFAVRDDTIVVEGVPAIVILRSGKLSATLENKGKARPPAPKPAALAAVPAATEKGE